MSLMTIADFQPFFAAKLTLIPCHFVKPDGSCSCGKHADGCKPGKHPYGRQWLYAKDTATIEKYLRSESRLNWAVLCGGGLAVLDIDPRHGGIEQLARLVAQHGPLPPTPTVLTGRHPDGSRGRHYYFAAVAGIETWDVAPGVEIQGERAIAICPPSTHASGVKYEWEIPLGSMPLALLPSWLVRQQAKPTPAPAPKPAASGGPTLASCGSLVFDLPAPDADLTTHPGESEGSRNASLAKLVGQAIGRGLEPDIIEFEALAWAERCDPPYPERDVMACVRGLLKADRRKADTRGGVIVLPTTPSNERSFSETDDGDLCSFARTLPAEETAATVPSGFSTSTPLPTLVDASRPILEADALHGLLGRTIRAIAPETEADPAGVALTLLIAFGNAVGGPPHLTLGSRRHACNQFGVLVGKTASRKGECWGIVRYLLSMEADWLTGCVVSSLGSGEGLVERVKDELHVQEFNKKTGEVETVVFPGAIDKRLLIVEEEFRKVLTLCRRPESTLTSNLLAAWDGVPMQVLNRGKNSLKASNHHISLLGMITPSELRSLLESGTEGVNGFSNRPLWCWVERSNTLPFGGNIRVLDAFKSEWAAAIADAKERDAIGYDESFRMLFADLCPVLDPDAEDDSLTVRALERARPHVWRLSMIFALIDGVGVMTEAHLRAAVAVWRYSAATCRLVFAKDVAEVADDLPNRLLSAIRKNSAAGLRLTDLHAVCGRKERAEAIHAALTALEQAGAVERREVPTAGRPAERWYPRAWAGSLAAIGGTQQQGGSLVFDLPQPERTNEESAGGDSRPSEGILTSFAGEPANAEGGGLLRSPNAPADEIANTPPCSSEEPLALPEEWSGLATRSLLNADSILGTAWPEGTTPAIRDWVGRYVETENAGRGDGELLDFTDPFIRDLIERCVE